MSEAKGSAEHPARAAGHFGTKSSFAVAVHFGGRVADDAVAVRKYLNAFADRFGRERSVLDRFLVARRNLGNDLPGLLSVNAHAGENEQ